LGNLKAFGWGGKKGQRRPKNGNPKTLVAEETSGKKREKFRGKKWDGGPLSKRAVEKEGNWSLGGGKRSKKGQF